MTLRCGGWTVRPREPRDVDRVRVCRPRPLDVPVDYEDRLYSRVPKAGRDQRRVRPGGLPDAGVYQSVRCPLPPVVLRRVTRRGCVWGADGWRQVYRRIYESELHDVDGRFRTAGPEELVLGPMLNAAIG